MRHYVTSSRYDGMKKLEARRLPRLEEEHQWPKRLVGDQAPNSRVLKGVPTATVEQFEQSPGEGTLKRRGVKAAIAPTNFFNGHVLEFFQAVNAKTPPDRAGFLTG